MAGVLDSKTRILDTIITLEGRRQIASGRLKAEFYSFSDAGAFYTQDTSLSGALDGTKRIYLEASPLPQDSITFEADDAGKLVRFPSSPAVVRNGVILTQVTSSTEVGKIFFPAQDDVFASMADELLSSSLGAFANCYILGSPDIFDENRDEFTVRPSQMSFRITDKLPISYNSEIYQGNVETTDGLFVDSRLSHLPNFQYLPPINKHRLGDDTVTLLGNYPILNQRPQLTIQDVENEIEWAVKRGFSQEMVFEETSRTNNLVCQVFEIGGNEIVKLDVIDFGLFSLTGEDLTLSEKKRQEKDPRNRPNLTKHVFFVGKVFTDTNGVHKFITLFTLVFE